MVGGVLSFNYIVLVTAAYPADGAAAIQESRF